MCRSVLGSEDRAVRDKVPSLMKLVSRRKETNSKQVIN